MTFVHTLEGRYSEVVQQSRTATGTTWRPSSAWTDPRHPRGQRLQASGADEASWLSGGRLDHAGERRPTRVQAVPPDSLYGVAAGGLRFDALPVHYDHDGWMAQFEAVWPAGSDAHASCHARLVRGPKGFTRRHAAREGVS